MMKTKILKLLISTAWLLPLAPAAVLAKTDPEKADPAEHTEMSAAASEEDSDYGEDSDPAIMPSAPVCHGLAGVAWAVDENRILYLQAGRLEKTNFHQLFDVPSIREIRVVPTEY